MTDKKREKLVAALELATNDLSAARIRCKQAVDAMTDADRHWETVSDEYDKAQKELREYDRARAKGKP